MGGDWAETAELYPGLELVTADGRRAVVVSALKTDRIERTYNFEVEGFHTYFVGETGVWVHNACTPGLLRQLRLHIQKLDDYVRNPLAHDNKGILRSARSEQEFNRIFTGRVRGLQSQIRNFLRQINDQ